MRECIQHGRTIYLCLRCRRGDAGPRKSPCPFEKRGGKGGQSTGRFTEVMEAFKSDCPRQSRSHPKAANRHVCVLIIEIATAYVGLASPFRQLPLRITNHMEFPFASVENAHRRDAKEPAKWLQEFL